jgi:hypothetical protein
MADETLDEVEANPLHKKLGLRPGLAAAVIAAPEGDSNPLAPLPEGTASYASVEDFADTAGQLEYIHVFARNRTELTRHFAALREHLSPAGSLWVSWIKQSSGRRGGGLPGDLNENVIRRMALSGGLVDVKVAALDHEWAALRLVHRKH